MNHNLLALSGVSTAVLAAVGLVTEGHFLSKFGVPFGAYAGMNDLATGALQALVFYLLLALLLGLLIGAILVVVWALATGLSWTYLAGTPIPYASVTVASWASTAVRSWLSRLAPQYLGKVEADSFPSNDIASSFSISLKRGHKVAAALARWFLRRSSASVTAFSIVLLVLAVGVVIQKNRFQAQKLLDARAQALELIADEEPLRMDRLVDWALGRLSGILRQGVKDRLVSVQLNSAVGVGGGNGRKDVVNDVFYLGHTSAVTFFLPRRPDAKAVAIPNAKILALGVNARFGSSPPPSRNAHVAVSDLLHQQCRPVPLPRVYRFAESAASFPSRDEDQDEFDFLRELDALIDPLVKDPAVRLWVTASADPSGDAATNLNLSKRRANKVASYIAKRWHVETPGAIGEGERFHPGETDLGRFRTFEIFACREHESRRILAGSSLARVD